MGMVASRRPAPAASRVPTAWQPGWHFLRWQECQVARRLPRDSCLCGCSPGTAGQDFAREAGGLLFKPGLRGPVNAFVSASSLHLMGNKKACPVIRLIPQ